MMVKGYLCILIMLLISLSSFADSLKSDQDLLKEPKIKSDVVGKAKKGNVEIIEKKGFWVKVKSNGLEGWTKMSNVQVDSSKSLDVAALDSGREGGGNIVSTSGVRGLDGAELADAQPDKNEFENMKKLLVSSEDGKSFASQSQLESRDLKYFPDPENTQNSNPSPLGGR
jgi:hypothetical protein